MSGAHSILEPVADLFLRARSRIFGAPKVPTLMHITHPKAGSSWITGILHELFGSRVAPRGRQVAEASGGDLDQHVFERGRVYPAMFMTRQQVLAHPELNGCKRFIVIRDLRDTMAALFIGMKYSPPYNSQGRARRLFERLNECSDEDGLMIVLDEQMAGIAALQASWAQQGEVLIRYEELFGNASDFLRDALIGQLGLPVTASAITRAFRRLPAERPQRASSARGPGDNAARCDWHSLFTPKVSRAFAERYGQLLIDTGYAGSLAWADAQAVNAVRDE
jgi:lipopolysaccharide transport system ATP-binding protein